MPNWGGGVRGAASGAGAGSFFGPVGTGIGAGVGFLGGLFSGGGDDKDKEAADPELDQLRQSSTAHRDTASSLKSLGSDALAPVLNYFSALLGNNPAALMEATKADRGRVIDQYDAARTAIAQFGPRGGGTTSAMAASRTAQAHQLNDVMSTARRDAATQAGQLGTAVTGLGLSADQLASADLNSVINAILTKEGFDVTKRGQNLEAATGIGEALGSLFGIWMTRDQGGTA